MVEVVEIESSDDDAPLVSAMEAASIRPNPTIKKKKKKKTPFSRADYSRRRQKHTEEERLFQNHLTTVFRRKIPWSRIRFYVWYANLGNPNTPIVIA
jgi:hypothetical protein